MRDATYYTHGQVWPADQLAMIVPSQPDLHREGVNVNHLARLDESADPLYTYANLGRWVVECECYGAQLTSVTDQRFMCVNCGNAEHGGLYRPVIWPYNWKRIGALLDARRDYRMRNWRPPETLADLRMENELLKLEGALR